MKKNSVFILVGVVVSTASYFAVKNLQFQEEKRLADIEILKHKTACNLKPVQVSEMELRKALAKEKPEYTPDYEAKLKDVEAANEACKKVEEYTFRYGSP